MIRPACIDCDAPIAAARAALGYTLCMPCGERAARARRHTIVPLNKSNYVPVTDRTMLRQLNPKHIPL